MTAIFAVVAVPAAFGAGLTLLLAGGSVLVVTTLGSRRLTADLGRASAFFVAHLGVPLRLRSALRATAAALLAAWLARL